MATESLAHAWGVSVGLDEGDAGSEVACSDHEALRLPLEDGQTGNGGRRLRLLLILLLCLQHAVEAVRLVSHHDFSIHVA